MRRGTLIAVLLTGFVLVGIAVLALETARRDRAALVKAFGDEHLVRLRIAIHEIETELSDVRQHLELTTRLVDTTNSGADQRRELEALVAVVRSYRMVVVYDLQGHERVAAIDNGAAASWSRRPYAEAVRATALTAMSEQRMAISDPLGDDASAWHRAFAAPLLKGGEVRGAIVILADQKATFDRLRLVAPDPPAKLILFGPHGRIAPMTDAAIAADAARVPEPGGAIGDLMRAMRDGHTGTSVIRRSEARALGLGDAEGIAVFAPIRTGDAGHWSVAVLDSTAALQSQENAIVLRMELLAALFALALGSLSVYLVVSARRAIAVQEQLRSAEHLSRLREKAEKILEKIPVAVVALDELGRVSSMNVAARDRLGDEALGGTVDQAFPEASAGAVEAIRGLLAKAQGEGKVQRLLAQPLTIDRHAGFYAVHAVPLTQPLPDMRLLLVLEDVTEIRALGSQLLRAEKLATVGVIASGIAHEVGTPLGVVRGRAELLARRFGPEQPESKSTAVILEEIDRISRIIRELLDFARVAQAEVAPVAIEAVASTVAELLAFEARKRKVSIGVEVASGLGPLAANADQLKQVLVNLVLNGMDACGPGGRVLIKAQPGEREGMAILEVADDGAGIPEDLRHRVFDPFFTTKKRGKGTGLGLTVVSQIVRNHGGEIDLESAVGRGTRVTMTWPLGAAQTEGRHAETERRTYSGRR
jgi:signal transduction histidine kinase